jgi:hypothetical protein
VEGEVLAPESRHEEVWEEVAAVAQGSTYGEEVVVALRGHDWAVLEEQTPSAHLGKAGALRIGAGYHP